MPYRSTARTRTAERTRMERVAPERTRDQGVRDPADRNTKIKERTHAISYSATVNKLLIDVEADQTESAVKTDAVGETTIRNTGGTPVFTILAYRVWTAGATMSGNTYHLHHLLRPGEDVYVPDTMAVISDGDVEPLIGTAVDNLVPDSNMYTDSTADVDHATSATLGSDATHTTLNLEDGHSKFLRVGDLIRLENEICEVTAVGTGADLANSTATIIRGQYGSTAATHADDVAVRLPFFNAYHDFDRYSVAQTDGNTN